VRVTYDGQAALDTLGTFQPAAVFLDLGMSGMDGHEVGGESVLVPTLPTPCSLRSLAGGRTGTVVRLAPSALITIS
jgi:hypothetical protein